jgi:hypothetical protein
VTRPCFNQELSSTGSVSPPLAIDCPRKLSVPRRVQGYRITDPVPVSGSHSDRGSGRDTPDLLIVTCAFAQLSKRDASRLMRSGRRSVLSTLVFDEVAYDPLRFRRTRGEVVITLVGRRRGKDQMRAARPAVNRRRSGSEKTCQRG